MEFSDCANVNSNVHSEYHHRETSVPILDANANANINTNCERALTLLKKLTGT